jgi:drug/metabolite transporter (DMT)-like permease
MGIGAVVLNSCGWVLYSLLVSSWLEAYKAKKWALLSLGLMSIAVSIGFSVLAFLHSNHADAVVLLPVAALAAAAGVYVLRLRARLIRLGLP